MMLLTNAQFQFISNIFITTYYTVFSCFDPHKSVSVTLSVLEKPGAKLTALIKNLSPLTRAQYLLLRNVTSHERRCQLLRDGHLEVEVGDQVMFSSPRAADTVPVLARSVATATV